MPKNRCLLVNPWIYDFAAFDLWSKPIGLLYIGGVMRDHGWDVDLLDCLDRFDPVLEKKYTIKNKKYFTGKYVSETIEKPAVLKNVPRYYKRFGIPEKLVLEKLNSIDKPDVILITSVMTYWYPAILDIVALLKNVFPEVPVVLGGIYATLIPEHAREKSDVDLVIDGEAENILPKVLSEKFGFDIEVKTYPNLDSLPYPALDLYPELHYLPILTTRGCPLRCSFCASNRISGKFRKRSIDAVVDELQYFTVKKNIENIAFFDDALLFDKEDHIIPLIEKVLHKGMNPRFHTPNGLQADKIDRDIAELMVRAGFSTIRLSLETIAAERKKDISGKVTPDNFANAVKYLYDAGVEKPGIEAYMIMGLPGQKPEEVIDTIYFAAENGVISRPAAFSPIPGTKDWNRAVECGDLTESADLLETNTTVYINQTKYFDENITSSVRNLAVDLNERLRNGRDLPDKKEVKRDIL